jgi:hypothetical protein
VKEVLAADPGRIDRIPAGLEVGNERPVDLLKVVEAEVTEVLPASDDFDAGAAALRACEGLSLGRGFFQLPGRPSQRLWRGSQRRLRRRQRSSEVERTLSHTHLRGRHMILWTAQSKTLIS